MSEPTIIEILLKAAAGFAILLFPFALGYLVFRIAFTRVHIERKAGKLFISKNLRKYLGAILFFYEGLAFVVSNLPIPGVSMWWFQLLLLIPVIAFRRTFFFYEIVADRSRQRITRTRQSLVKKEEHTIPMTGMNSITVEPVTQWGSEEAVACAVHVSNNSMLTDLVVTSGKEASQIVTALNEYFFGEPNRLYFVSKEGSEGGKSSDSTDGV